MEISGLEEFGLRCILQVARVHDDQKSISAAEIARLEGISTEYSSKFMFLLRKGGLVRAVRGAKGGFSMARDPAEISLREVFEALHEEPYKDEWSCSKHSGQREECVHMGSCSIRPVWVTLTQFWVSFIESIALSDLLNDERSVHQLITERWLNVVKASDQEKETNPHVRKTAF